MKILIVSLLRVGDIVSSTPVFRGLRDRYPEAEIHLLVNSQFKRIERLIPYVDRVIPFERDLMQKGLGDSSVPVFESYERLNGLVDALNGERYDWAINLTQNRLSGWLMGLIEAKTVSGLCFDSQGQVGFGSSWFQFLNQQVEAEGKETFHFTDIFRFALGFDPEEVSTSEALSETAEGKQEAAAAMESFANAQSLIAVQPLTSDVKKNWGFRSFERAISVLALRQPGSSFAIIGAPFEKERLEPFVSSLRAQNIDAYLAILSLEGAFSLLKRSKLLLTGDTSIKHLAASAGTRIVEVCVGSSDPYRTGAYTQNAVIVKSRESCAPCAHSSPCHRESQFCAQGISPEAIGMIAGEVYANRMFQLQAIAEEYADAIEVLRVEKKVSGFWSAYSVLDEFTEEAVARWVDLSCRKIWLDGERGRRGTEALRLSRLLTTIYPDISKIEWRHLLADLDRQLRVIDSRLNGLKVGLRYLKGCYEDPRKMKDFVRGLIAFRERIRHSILLRSFKSGLDQVIDDDMSSPFTRFRRMIGLVAEIERRSAIYGCLLRDLTSIVDPRSGSKGVEKV